MTVTPGSFFGVAPGVPTIPYRAINHVVITSKSARKRIATAIVREDAKLIRISRTIFLRVLEEFPDLAADLHNRIATSVTDLVSQLERVQRKFAGQ